MLVRKSYHKSLPNNSKPHSVHGDCFTATVKFNTSCSFCGIFDYTNISWKKGRTVCWLSWVFCQMQCKAAKQSHETKRTGGSVTECLERWTCDSEPGLVHGSPQFKSSVMFVNNQLVCLRTVGILNPVYVWFELFVSCICSVPLALVL